MIRRLLRGTRGLRFRLAFSYVAFFAVLVVALGFVFRQTLNTILQAQSENILEEEWGAAKGYFEFKDTGPDWAYDSADPDEDFLVTRLKHVYMLADSQGHKLQYSTIYESLGFDSADEIGRILKSGTKSLRVRTDQDGTPYLVRAGPFYGPKRQVYYLAIGRSIGDNRKILDGFTRNYLFVVPAIVVFSGLLGWFMAGRALAPVNSVAETAQHITHSNLDMRIPLRGAGDELDRLVEAFNRMMGRLNLSFEQIRQFSTDVSHELRTPLTIVRGQLEVALFTANTAEQYREAMVNALEDVDRLTNIVRALLMLSQAESGQLALHKTEIEFSEVVRDQVDQFQIPAEDQGVHLSADLPAVCRIQADRIQIERLISNLLSNAIKYTPRGGEVRVRLDCAGADAHLVVEDTGVGISSENVPHIFDRFYRVPSADPEKGLGLGLSFVAWIVKAHGGTINVDSMLDRGTRFTVTLPSGEAPLPAALEEAQAYTTPEQLN
ncbi:MAG: ATP-binding protein [Acidobacteriota bacterium]|nr:ATP-binding protein [Acidobacteriota bacterium]